MGITDGNSTTPQQQPIEIVSGLESVGGFNRLDFGDRQQDYTRFCYSLHTTVSQGLISLSKRLDGDRNLAALLACIWAMIQGSKQDELCVLEAAEKALELLGDREGTPFVLTGILWANREWLSSEEAFPLHFRDDSKRTSEHYDIRFFSPEKAATAAEKLLECIQHMTS